jgi:hypothetical protein
MGDTVEAIGHKAEVPNRMKDSGAEWLATELARQVPFDSQWS